MGYPRLKTTVVQYEASKHMPLGTVARKLGFTPNYIWYVIARAYRLTRFTNEKGSKFFSTEEIRKAIPRIERNLDPDGTHKQGAIAKLLGRRPKGKKTRRAATRNGTAAVTLQPRSGAPVVEIDADQLADLVRRGAVYVKLKT